MTRSGDSHSRYSPEYALLGFLYDGPAHGYELHQRLVHELGYIWRVSLSQTYNILKRLESQGDITSKTVKQKKLPARQILNLTTSGRGRFDTWLNAPTCSSVHAIRLEFITRLYFAQHQVPEKVQHILDAQATSINATLNRLELSQAGLPSEQTFNRLSLQLRIQQLRSVLNWLAECNKTLDHNS